MWMVYLVESGEEKVFATKHEAKEWMDEVIAFDKRNGIVGETYMLIEEDEYSKRAVM